MSSTKTPGDARPGSRRARLPLLPAVLFRALTPHAERREVLADVADEFDERSRRRGQLAARLWLWRQLVASMPAMLARTWWRGWTGFEPRASRMQPGGPMFESWIMDLRYSTRRLMRRRAYTALAVVTLALGAGGTAAVFSIVRELLIAPLPIAREDEVGVLWFSGSWTEEEFLAFRPDFPGFARMAAYRPEDSTLELGGGPLRLVRGLATSAEFFDVLGARALLGRTFDDGDDRPGADPSVVIGHALWQELGGDAAMVGRRLNLGGVARTVIGVMPPGFWYPTPEVQVWTAASLRPTNRSGMYTLVGRVAEGHRVASMQAPLAALARALGERFSYPPAWDKTRAPDITSAREHLVGDIRPSLVATLVAMTLILGIACVNVAALMLGQLGGRSTELAVRSALGAGKQRLLQQLVVESLLIGLLAGAAGAALAAGGFQMLVRSLPLGELAAAARIDWAMLWAAIAVALVAATLIATVPGVAMWRSGLQATMATSRTGGIGGRGGRLEGALVVAQIALAVLLAASAGLLVRSVANLRAIDPGFEVRDRAVLDATLPVQLAPDARRPVITGMLTTLEALPGARGAAATQKLPLRGSGNNWGIRVEGQPNLERTTTAFRIVTRDYLHTLGAAIRSGRDFASTDRADTERVVIINEAAAARYFPGEDPLGRIVHTGFDERGERIVGVVENMAEADLTGPPVPARYMLYEQVPVVPHEVTFVVAAANQAQLPLLLQSAQRAIQTPSSRLALQGTVTMQSVFDDAVGAPGRVATLLTMLAGLALVLGAIGVYGVISHAVARRTRDYGIHIALGLEPSRVVSQVVRRGLRLAAAGSVLGIAATLLLTESLESLLYDVGRADPVALAGAVLALLVIGAAAALVPAWRASRTDPAAVLRQQ